MTANVGEKPEASPLLSARSAPSGVACQCCGKPILDGNVLLCRVVLVGAISSRAKCPRCKNWVVVPLALAVPNPKTTA